MGIEKLALSPTETAEVLGLSRPTVYQLMKRPDFPAFRVGRRTLVSAELLRDWVRARASSDAECQIILADISR